MNLEKVIRNLTLRGHTVQFFPKAEDALTYLCEQLHDTEVGIGGSKTVEQLGLYDRLSENNIVYWHWRNKDASIRQKENAAPVFISSANALAESGEIINIDGTGNRLAGQVYGRKKVYFVVGTNKICPSLESAISRARNVAGVQNAARFPVDTPCKQDGKCHDCRVPGKVCNAMLILWGPMSGMETEVVLIDGEYGY